LLDMCPVKELERLQGCHEASQTTLRATEAEAETVRAQLADADGRVAGKFFWRSPFSSFSALPF
jgi:hypothetical protein